MKNFILFVAILCATAIVQAIQIDLTQKVSRRENRKQIWTNQNSYEKNVSRTKTFTLKVSNMSEIDVVVFFFATVGGELYSDVISDKVSSRKPLIYEYTGSAASQKINIDFTYIDDYKSKSGNDKVEACAFVYDKKTGKLLGQKQTSKYFADSIFKSSEENMRSVLKEYQNAG